MGCGARRRLPGEGGSGEREPEPAGRPRLGKIVEHSLCSELLGPKIRVFMFVHRDNTDLRKACGSSVWTL
ncbi:unnamed protein product [Caretta caretta]